MWMYIVYFFNKMLEINYWNWILYFCICYRLYLKRSVLWEVDINFDCMVCVMFNSMKNVCIYGYFNVGCLWFLLYLLCLLYSLGMGLNFFVNLIYSLILCYWLLGSMDGIILFLWNFIRVWKLIKFLFIECF